MSHFGRARRFALWFLALSLHTINALLYVSNMEKDQWCLLMKRTGLGITLIFCFGLVMLLHQSFPITKDVCICGGIFGFLYVVAATVTLYNFPTWSDIVLGLIHTLITLFMSILRFSCQAGFLKFEKFPLLVAVLGSIGGCLLPLAPLPKLSEISAYKVATLIGGLSRLLDVVFIMGLVSRDKVNHFLVRLQEFLI
ncbi:hypothetical protein SEVIR_5G339400v4 [Setaria viridis]|uniref:Uncharacterized protein n=2 Tax=Setaria TaxID=4554 RepID=A0A368RBM0_SETIT|nr:hypothetical protein SETIT_5G335200v2 [Setaria italica]TKW17038.1 hypothetical protein SEVIR_5G339400v2 [Setaria viridis]TKW17039.1 hypothetical protein SEVIR_5G339400v2 [Setaria viridis]